MAQLLTPVEAPPANIEISVSYYDEKEREKFESNGNYLIEQDEARFTISTADFCSYYLSYKYIRIDSNLIHLPQFARRWTDALYEFQDLLAFRNGSIGIDGDAPTNRTVSERIGEAIGLSITCNLFDVHDADWIRIDDRTGHKTLDFDTRMASDGQRIIVLEAKGSSVEDNRKKTPSISEHKSDIRDKKAIAEDLYDANAIKLGAIGVIDRNAESVARCWLVDPPAEVSSNSPRRDRLLTRLSFYSHFVRMITPRSALSISLNTRLAALNEIQDIWSLDRVPLRKGDNEPLFFDADQWRSQRSSLPGPGAIGKVLRIDNSLAFVGIQPGLIKHLMNQDFDAILNYKAESDVSILTLFCVVPKGQFRNEFSERETSLLPYLERKGQYVSFRVPGIHYQMSSGIVVGFCNISLEVETSSE